MCVFKSQRTGMQKSLPDKKQRQKRLSNLFKVHPASSQPTQKRRKTQLPTHFTETAQGIFFKITLLWIKFVLSSIFWCILFTLSPPWSLPLFFTDPFQNSCSFVLFCDLLVVCRTVCVARGLEILTGAWWAPYLLHYWRP